MNCSEPKYEKPFVHWAISLLKLWQAAWFTSYSLWASGFDMVYAQREHDWLVRVLVGAEFCVHPAGSYLRKAISVGGFLYRLAFSPIVERKDSYITWHSPATKNLPAILPYLALTMAVMNIHFRYLDPPQASGMVKGFMLTAWWRILSGALHYLWWGSLCNATLARNLSHSSQVWSMVRKSFNLWAQDFI